MSPKRVNRLAKTPTTMMASQGVRRSSPITQKTRGSAPAQDMAHIARDAPSSRSRTVLAVEKRATRVSVVPALSPSTYTATSASGASELPRACQSTTLIAARETRI